MKYISLAAIAACATATTALADGITGDFSISAGIAPYSNSDDNVTENGKAGYRISGSLGKTFGDYHVFSDFSYFGRDTGGESFGDSAPNSLGAAGLHAGRNFGAYYLGAFAGVNAFQGFEAASDVALLTGGVYGVEATYDIGRYTTYGQLGYADLQGEKDEVGFKGAFGRLGVATQFNKYTLIGEIEGGQSNDFFDSSSEKGTYLGLSAKVEYAFSDRLIGTFSYDHMQVQGNDRGQGDFVSIGIRVPLGGARDALSPRSLLTTPYRPGLAAAWAETIF